MFRLEVRRATADYGSLYRLTYNGITEASAFVGETGPHYFERTTRGQRYRQLTRSRLARLLLDWRQASRAHPTMKGSAP